MRRASLLVLLAACGAREPARPPMVEPPCPFDGEAYLSIILPKMPDDCPGGVYVIDGREMGRYPVRCARVPAGDHHLNIRSVNDCAGYIDCEVHFEIGQEVRWEPWRAGCPAPAAQNQSSP